MVHGSLFFYCDFIIPKLCHEPTPLKLGKELPPSIQPRRLELRHSPHRSAINHPQMQSFPTKSFQPKFSTKVSNQSFLTTKITTTSVITTVITTVIITAISQRHAPSFQRRAPSFHHRAPPFQRRTPPFQRRAPSFQRFHCAKRKGANIFPYLSSNHRNML